ncbi:MAG: hypothetical protein JXL80_10605 [Planctomycetes bacterium]|nr:hypothetical protein [Planctomycetota bacterium]
MREYLESLRDGFLALPLWTQVLIACWVGAVLTVGVLIVRHYRKRARSRRLRRKARFLVLEGKTAAALETYVQAEAMWAIGTAYDYGREDDMRDVLVGMWLEISGVCGCQEIDEGVKQLSLSISGQEAIDAIPMGPFQGAHGKRLRIGMEAVRLDNAIADMRSKLRALVMQKARDMAASEAE